MARLYICVGPPCSGKSTWAKQMAKDHNTIRINRDDLRAMFKGDYIYGDSISEEMSTLATVNVARIALYSEVDVILDNTNCAVSTIKSILEETAKIPFKVDIIFKVFDIPYWKQRWRNFYRVGFAFNNPRYVTSKVAKLWNKNFQETKTFVDGYNNSKPHLQEAEAREKHEEAIKETQKRT